MSVSFYLLFRIAGYVVSAGLNDTDAFYKIFATGESLPGYFAKVAKFVGILSAWHCFLFTFAADNEWVNVIILR